MSLRIDRTSSIVEMKPEEFRKAGYEVIDRITEFLKSLPAKPVAPGKTPKEMRTILGNSSLPLEGNTYAGKLLNEASDLLFHYTTFNGHPKFWGYITSSATPIGALADLLASAVNPNVGAGNLSLAATEIEAQTIRWIAELIGYPIDCGGIMVSGGNMANFVGFLAARKAIANWDVRKEGLQGNRKQLVIYAATATHTWIHKAADLFGMGTDAIHWIDIDENQKMIINDLKKKIEYDKKNDLYPFIVVGNAGTVGTGTTDPLEEISSICKENNLWFHVDGAYGAVAATLQEASKSLKALKYADSVALDPHKWLYAPLEAGCTLVHKPELLLDAFSYHPEYYRFEGDEEDKPINFYEYGLQNSRGFRALKVWLSLRQAGKNGYVKMISEDIELAKYLFDLISAESELEAVSNNLSITTFRYVPDDLKKQKEKNLEYLNELNEELLARLQNSGEAYVSNAIVNEKFVLRVCIVNFRTTKSDIEALPIIVKKFGKQADKEKRSLK